MDSSGVTSPPLGVKAAPFSYGRRRSVWDTRDNVAAAMDAARGARPSATPLVAPQGHRMHAPRTSRATGQVRDMATSVHERFLLENFFDGDATHRGTTTTIGASPSVSLSALSMPAPAFPPLSIEPVPACARSLRYRRSARAWTMLSTGCVAEAKRLAEEDNDVVAWAACFILGGDAQQGLLLLESYVIATCVVLHEVQAGGLSRASKGINPFSQDIKTNAEPHAAKPRRAESANPAALRRCLERHNQVLLSWMRHRDETQERTPPELAKYDVDVYRTSEAVVRHVVLQSMQLIDAVEVHRWYIAALMLYVSNEVGDATAGERAAGSKQKSNKGQRGGRAGVHGDHTSEADSVLSQNQSTHAATAAANASAAAASASDGYRAPQNLWFRYFFALGDTAGVSSADKQPMTATTQSSPSTRNGGVSAAVLTSYETAGRSDASSPAPPLKRASTKPSPHTAPVAAGTTHGASSGARARQPNTHSSALVTSGDVASMSAGAAAVAETTVPLSRRESSAAQQQPGRLARTLSWFKDRGRSSSQAQPNASLTSSFRVLPPPTWHLAATVSLDQEQTCSLLLAHREEWDVYFVTAVTAFFTQHYRTCMMAASRFLRWAEAHASAGLSMSRTMASSGDAPLPRLLNATSHRAATKSVPMAVPGLQTYQLRLALLFRAWSALQIGERLQSGKDIVRLLDDKEDALGYHVGCALALYGLPLPAAKDTLIAATQRITHATLKITNSSSDKNGEVAVDVKGERGAGAAAATPRFSVSVQIFLYLVAEAVHAVTLLQLGLVEPAMGVAKTALKRAEVCGVREEDTMLMGALRDVLVKTATALEDSRAILDVPLSPHRLVYLAVCPAFFGGVCAGGIRVKAHSDTHRMLYPTNLPLYASTRQMIPFHLNRAVYLFHSGQLDGAWDDACCAVAAADEVVGSVEFAFSDCFPLQVYNFACSVGLFLLESLLAADLDAAKACLAKTADQKTMDEKDARLQEDELLSKEIVHICQDIVQRMHRFYPHARVTELCDVRLAVACGAKDYLGHAVALSRRYPHSPAAQNVLTFALYFDHHIPEAVDNAKKNLQAFPHSSEVIRLHRTLQKKHVTYNFNYRGLLPTRYKPGSHDRVFTKRMVIVFILLLANIALLCITAFVNIPSVTDLPYGIAFLAVRMQLPTVAPLFFAAIFVIHALIAAVTTKNLIATTLTDLFFVNTSLNRALFCLRCLPLVNLINAVLVSTLGNNFLFESGSATFVLYFFLGILFVPFTTRIWFLPSIDEPDVGFMSWLAILSVDVVVAFFVLVPHIIAAFLEPYMLILFYFFAPAARPGMEKDYQPPSSSIRRRLLLHAHDSKSMPRRFTTGSGSRFIHIWVMKWLYLWSHCTMETRFLAEAQLEAESYRVFPLLDGEEAEVLFAEVPLMPLCAAMSSTEEVSAVAATVKKENGSAARRRQRVGRSATSENQKKPEEASLQTRLPASPDVPHRVDGASSATTQELSASPSSSASSRSPFSGSGRHQTLAPAGNAPSAEAGATTRVEKTHNGTLLHSNDRRRMPANGEAAARWGHGSTTAEDEDEDDDGDGDLDATLVAGVRTVDAMRQQLDRTTRARPSTMRHAASFVRSALAATHRDTVISAEDSDDYDGEDDGTVAEVESQASNPFAYYESLMQHSQESHHRSRGAAAGSAAMRSSPSQFPEDVFGRTVTNPKPPQFGGVTSDNAPEHDGSRSDFHSSSSSGSSSVGVADDASHRSPAHTCADAGRVQRASVAPPPTTQHSDAAYKMHAPEGAASPAVPSAATTARDEALASQAASSETLASSAAATAAAASSPPTTWDYHYGDDYSTQFQSGWDGGHGGHGQESAEMVTRTTGTPPEQHVDSDVDM